MNKYLIVSGVPKSSNSVIRTFALIKQQFDSHKISAFCWLNTYYGRSFFKGNGLFVWSVFQITKLYKPSRSLIDLIYYRFGKPPGVGNIQEEFSRLGLEKHLTIDSYNLNSKSFCTLNDDNRKVIELHAKEFGSTNILGFQHMKTMFEGIKRAVKASGAIDKEAVIVRIRPDLVVLELNLDKYIKHIEGGEYDLVSFCQCGQKENYSDFRLCDQFFIAKLGVLYKIFDALTQLDQIYFLARESKVSSFGGEVILGLIAREIGIKSLTVEGIKRIER
jgi:hypothetical protein